MGSLPDQQMANVRYVILHHKGQGGEHWDLMLEDGLVLATWQLSARPTGDPGESIAARALGHHRKRYLDYEGPIGGDRGQVTRYDRGTYRSVERSPDRWGLELAGAVLAGPFELVQPARDCPDKWVFGPVADTADARARQTRLTQD